MWTVSVRSACFHLELTLGRPCGGGVSGQAVEDMCGSVHSVSCRPEWSRLVGALTDQACALHARLISSLARWVKSRETRLGRRATGRIRIDIVHSIDSMDSRRQPTGAPGRAG